MSNPNDLNDERLIFIRKMILKLRQALLDGLEVVSISSSAGSASYNRKEMEERLAEYEAEEKQLTGGPNLGPIIKTADMRGTMSP